MALFTCVPSAIWAPFFIHHSPFLGPAPVPFIPSLVFIDAPDGIVDTESSPDDIILSLRRSQTTGCKAVIPRSSLLGTSNGMRDQHSEEFAAC